MVQWLGCQASPAGGTGLIPDWGTKVTQDRQHDPRELKEKHLICM